MVGRWVTRQIGRRWPGIVEFLDPANQAESFADLVAMFHEFDDIEPRRA